MYAAQPETPAWTCRKHEHAAGFLNTTCMRKLEIFWGKVRQPDFFTTVFGPLARRII